MLTVKVATAPPWTVVVSSDEEGVTNVIVKLIGEPLGSQDALEVAGTVLAVLEGKKVKARWLEPEGQVRSWLAADVRVVAGPDTWTPWSLLHRRFRDWQKANGCKGLKQFDWAMTLERAAGYRSTRRNGIHGVNGLALVYPGAVDNASTTDAR